MKLFQIGRAIRGFVFVAVCLALALALGQSQSTSSIEGVAVDGNGAVISGAKVTVFCDCKECPNRPCAECCPADFSRTVTTDDQGQFRIADVPAGVYRLRGEVTGFKAVDVHGVQVSVQSAATVTLRFETGGGAGAEAADEKASLRVKIIDSLTDKPLENAKVTLLLQCDCRKECPTKPCSECCPSEKQMFTSVTDASGTVTFDGPPGTYRIDTAYRAYSKDSVVTVAAGETEKLKVKLTVKEQQ